MGSVRQENENGDRVAHRKGIRVTSVNALRTRRRRTTMKCCSCVQYPGLAERANELVSTIPTHAVFIFLNPLMVDLLQVEYQNKGTTPFETHAPNMWIFFVATCAHCLGLAFEMKLQRSGALWCRVLSNLVLFFGALSSVSLASVFLPRALGWVCLTLFSFTAGFPLLLSASKCLSHRINVDFMNRFTAHKPCLPK